MLTETQISSRRAERNMASRAKAKAKASRYGQFLQDRARGRKDTAAWLKDLAMSQNQAQKTLDDTRRAALEASRTKAVMSNHPPKSLIGRIGAFFKPRGR